MLESVGDYCYNSVGDRSCNFLFVLWQLVSDFVLSNIVREVTLWYLDSLVCVKSLYLNSFLLGTSWSVDNLPPFFCVVHH